MVCNNWGQCDGKQSKELQASRRTTRVEVGTGLFLEDGGRFSTLYQLG